MSNSREITDQFNVLRGLLNSFNTNLERNVTSLNRINEETLQSNRVARENTPDFNSQATSAEGLANSMQRMSSYLDDSNERLDNALDQFNAMKKISKGFVNDVLGKLPEQVKSKLAPLSFLSKLKFGNIKSSFMGLGESFKDMSKQVMSVGDGPGRSIKQLGILTKFAGSSFSKFMHPAINIVMSLGEAFIKATAQLIKFSSKITQFIATIPLQMTSAAAEIGNALRSEVIETIGNAVESTKEFFDVSEQFGGVVAKTVKSSQKFAEENIILFNNVRGEFAKLYGVGAAGAAEFTKAIANNIKDLGTFSDLFGAVFSGINEEENVQRMLVFDKLRREIGLSSEDMSYFALDAKAASKGIIQTMIDVRTSIYEGAQQFSLNAKTFGKNFLSLRKDIISFGHLTNDQLKETVGRLTQMGVAMQEAKNIFSKLDTFESAAQTSAMLSQTFGMNVDALKLIKEEDPANIIQTFSDAMLTTGRSFEELNRHEKAVMAQTTGLSAEALKATMNFMDMGLSFEEAQQKMKESDPTHQQIKALQTMTGSLKEIKKIVAETSFFTSFGEGLKNTLIYTTGLNKSFVAVSERMQSFFEVGLDLSKNQKIKKAFDDMLSPVKSLLDEMVGTNGLFNSDLLANSIEKPLLSISSIISKSFQDGANISVLQRNFSNMLNTAFDPAEMALSPNNPFNALLSIGGKFAGKVIKGFSAIGPGLFEVVGKALNSVVNYITGEGELFGDSGILKHLSKLFGLDDNAQEGLLNTYNSLVDNIIGSGGPLARLIGWFGKEAINLASKAAYNLGEVIFESLFGYNSYMYQAFKTWALTSPIGQTFRVLGLIGDIGPFKSQEGIFKSSAERNINRTLQSLDLDSMLSSDNFDERQAEDVGKIYSALKNRKDASSNRDITSLISKIDAQIGNIDTFSLRDDKVIREIVLAAKKIRGDSNIKYKSIKDGVDGGAGVSAINSRAIVTSTNSGIEVAEVGAMDQLLAGMPKGPIVNAIRYSGDMANAVYGLVSKAIKQNTSQTNNNNNNSNSRPIEIVLKLDSDVVARRLLSDDFVYKASTLDYTRGSTRLADNAKVNQSGGSNEMSDLG